MEGAFPSTSTKQGYHQQEEAVVEEKEALHHVEEKEFDLVDLDV